MSIAYVAWTAPAVAWMGIGSVQGRLVPGRRAPGRELRSLHAQHGVAGHDLPALRPMALGLRLGDLLILATDGIRPSFADALDVTGSAHDLAHRILAHDGRATDDALVLVARFLGVGP